MSILYDMFQDSVQLLCRVESSDGLANISTPYVFAVHAEFMNALPSVKEVDVCALVTITGRSYKADRADWHTRCVHQIVDCIVAVSAWSSWSMIILNM